MKPRKYRAKTAPQLLGVFNGEHKYTEQEWVYGYYAPTYLAEIDGEVKNTYCIISDDTIGEQEMLGCGHNTGLPKAYYIIEDTLGQSTGLFDKNGKEIFEGDIVKLKNGFYEGLYNYVEIEEDEYYAVYYDEEYARYDLQTTDNNTEFKRVVWYQLVNAKVEVIGNIYDNKELLKE